MKGDERSNLTEIMREEEREKETKTLNNGTDYYWNFLIKEKCIKCEEANGQNYLIF